MFLYDKGSHVMMHEMDVAFKVAIMLKSKQFFQMNVQHLTFFLRSSKLVQDLVSHVQS